MGLTPFDPEFWENEEPEIESDEPFYCNVLAKDGKECGEPVNGEGMCPNGHDWTPAGIMKGARLLGWKI